MIKSKFLINQFIFLLYCNAMVGQTSLNDCKNMLINCIGSMAQINVPTDKSIYRIKSTLNYVYKPAYTSQNTTVVADMFISKNKTFYESNYGSYFNDEKNSFVIIPSEKSIVWSDAIEIDNQKERLDKLYQIQDSLIKTGTMISCKDIVYQKKEYKEVILKPNYKLAKQQSVDKMMIIYDENVNRIIEVTLFYAKESKLDKMVMEYNIIDLNYSKPIASSAASKIYEGKSKLKNIYKGYTVVDKRKKIG
jgi:hypothetical protein